MSGGSADAGRRFRGGDGGGKRGPQPDAATEIWINASEQRPAAVRVDGRTIALAADRGGEACPAERDEQPPKYHRLDPRHTLALVPLACASGAYNALSLALLIPDGAAPRPARFDYGGEGMEDRDRHWLMGADWDPGKRRLTTFHKGRGRRRLRHRQEWAWAGARFRLVLQEVMEECRGSLDYIATCPGAVR